MNIRTFVFFDINSVGFTAKNRKNIKIIEFTLMAVSREDIVETDINVLPQARIMSQLVNPQTVVDIDRIIANTGLSIDILMNQPVFNEVVEEINTLLEDLPKPVCLVALHGNRFDFKVLRSEYQQAEASLPDELLCVDPRNFFSVQVDVSVDHGPDHHPGQSAMDNLNDLFGAMTTNPPSKDFLANLYNRLLTRAPSKSKRTNVRTEMLLECVMALKQPFLTWADQNGKLVTTITPYGQPATQPGNADGNQPGGEPGNETGNEPGNQPGNETETEPGNQPGNEPENQTD